MYAFTIWWQAEQSKDTIHFIIGVILMWIPARITVLRSISTSLLPFQHFFLQCRKKPKSHETQVTELDKNLILVTHTSNWLIGKITKYFTTRTSDFECLWNTMHQKFETFYTATSTSWKHCCMLSSAHRVSKKYRFQPKAEKLLRLTSILAALCITIAKGTLLVFSITDINVGS